MSVFNNEIDLDMADAFRLNDGINLGMADAFRQQLELLVFNDKINLGMTNAFRQQLEILDTLRFGVLVVTHEFDLIYQNRKVQDIFATLETLSNKRFPSILLTYCQQFMDATDMDDPDPLVIDHQPGPGRLLRWNISWMRSPLPQTDQPCLLVILEDCYQEIMSQMRREQKRYSLTDREAEIWQMIRLKCSYYEIADGLGITLNTVKTHVKNIYGKIREQPQHSKTWFLDNPERRDQINEVKQITNTSILPEQPQNSQDSNLTPPNQDQHHEITPIVDDPGSTPQLGEIPSHQTTIQSQHKTSLWDNFDRIAIMGAGGAFLGAAIVQLFGGGATQFIGAIVGVILGAASGWYVSSPKSPTRRKSQN